MIVRRRKRPVEVSTVQWTGTNEAEVQEFTGGASHFYALDAADREGCDDPEATATVFDRLHSTWVLVFTGQHIVRGVVGELYPIAEDVLAETYDTVDENYFQRGHTYVREHHVSTVRFVVTGVSTSPDGRSRAAHGWRTDDWALGWIAFDSEDFADWTDVTEAGEPG